MYDKRDILLNAFRPARSWEDNYSPFDWFIISCPATVHACVHKDTVYVFVTESVHIMFCIQNNFLVTKIQNFGNYSQESNQNILYPILTILA